MPISSPEKTLIDCLDRPELAGGATELTRIVHSGLPEIDPHSLLTAASTMKSQALLQRLGFLSDLVDRPLPSDVRQKIRQSIPKSYRSHFGRAEFRDGDMGYVAAWGLAVHARESDLLAEVPRIRPQKVA